MAHASVSWKFVQLLDGEMVSGSVACPLQPTTYAPGRPVHRVPRPATPNLRRSQFMESIETVAESFAGETQPPREGPVAKSLESVTSKLPSDIWLWASVGSMIVSLGLQLSRNKKTKAVSNFVGQWAPTLLVLGLYNKIVKVAGHDRAGSRFGEL